MGKYQYKKYDFTLVEGYNIKHKVSKYLITIIIYYLIGDQ